MRILITNDDGIGAPGIIALARWAAKLGKVTVAAPSSEQSGRSHAINLTTPYKIKKVPFPDGIEGVFGRFYPRRLRAVRLAVS